MEFNNITCSHHFVECATNGALIYMQQAYGAQVSVSIMKSFGPLRTQVFAVLMNAPVHL